MRFEELSKQVADVAAKLLTSGDVDCVIGFTESDVHGGGIPVIIREPSEAGRLVWNDRCVPNLSPYVQGLDGKAAVIAKPCDVRALTSLVAENQINRQDIHIVGMDCPCMKDPNGQILRACRDCKIHTPPQFDSHISDEAVQADQALAGDKGIEADVSTLQNAGSEIELQNNLERFTKEMEKCILCFSCRQAGYGCYCQTCFMDRGIPDWQPTNPDLGAKMLYHLGRAMHLAGRCVECGACENTCASGVDVRYLIREVTGFVKELYDYEAGLDPEKMPAMLTYRSDDKEVGFLGGGAHG